MSDPAQTFDEFLRVVRASGLVDGSRLDEAVAPWLGTAGPVPEECTQALLAKSLLTTWQLEQLRKGKHKGFFLGKYKLLRLLGTGGMSSVYLAEHSTLHNKVAIKVLPVKRIEQSSYLARFEREAQSSARLNHPNIARAFDLDTSGSIHFIAMEYIDGVDLHARVKQEGPLPVRDAAEYVRQAALGLHYAHEEGLVHRDIKPANLILDKRGTVKILDLGLALADDDEGASLTREHDEKVLGTADYLAPEQARDSHKADRRSDIYSLGCTLYYLLVGKAPFAKGTLAERIRAHMNEPAPNLLETRPDVPPAIAELYFRMLEKHPDARQQTAQQVADSLAAWLAATAPTAAGAAHRPLPEPPRRSGARRASGTTDPGGPPRRATPTPPGSRPPVPRPPTPSGGPGSDGGGSGSSVIRSGGAPAGRTGSDIDLHSLSFTPPPGSGSHPRSGKPSSTGGGVFIDTAAGSSAAPRSSRVTGSPAPQRGWWMRRYARIPLVVWLVAAVALVVAVTVAGWLLLGRGGAEPEDSETDEFSTPATVAPEKSTAKPPVKSDAKSTAKPPEKTPAQRPVPKPRSKSPGKPPAADEKSSGSSTLDNLESLIPGGSDTKSDAKTPDAKSPDAKSPDAKSPDAKSPDAK